MAIGPRIAVSLAAARRFVSMLAAERTFRRSVGRKMSQPEMYHSWLTGQSAWMPSGGSRSTPSQSSRTWDAWAAPRRSTTRQPIFSVTFPVTTAAIIITRSVAPRLCVTVRCQR
jgi:hypothetical protein